MTDAIRDYPHELPRHLHQADGVSKVVSTPDDCDAALRAGWVIDPNDLPATPVAPVDDAPVAPADPPAKKAKK